MKAYDDNKRSLLSDPRYPACLIASAVLPVIILLVVAYKFKLAPFGKDYFMTDDLQETYLPVISELRRKLVSHESLFFTWNSGGGTNFWALIGCYAASPLNLLYACFKESDIPAVTQLIFVIKTVLASLSLCWYLFRKEHVMSPLTVALSVGYSLSAYVLSYSQEPWLLDTVIMLPLLMLTLHKVIAGKNPWQFTICMAITLVTSYQAGFFVLLFMLLSFPLLYMEARSEKKARKFWTTFKDFFLYFSFGIGASSWMWFPVLRALSSSSVAMETLMFPRDLTMDLKIWDILERFSFDSVVIFPSEEISYPSLYCGIFVIFLVILFGFSSKISFDQKVYSYCTLVFLYMTMSSTVVNFVIAGLHFPITGAYPQAILMIFFAMYMCGRLIGTGMLFENKTHLQIAISIIGVFLIINSAINTELNYADYAVHIAIFFLIFYFAMAHKINDKSKGRFSFWMVLLALVMVVETGLSFYRPVKEKYYVLAMKNAVLDEKMMKHVGTAVRKEGLDKDEKMVYELSSSVLYDPMEIADEKLLAEVKSKISPMGRYADLAATWKNYGLRYGIASLNSTYYLNIDKYARTLASLGLSRSEDGSIVLYSKTDVMDMLFNLELSVSDHIATRVDETGSLHSIGFFTDSEKIYEPIGSKESVFENQNELAAMFGGLAPFEPVELRTVQMDNAIDNGAGSFTISQPETVTEVTYEFDAPINNPIYIYCRSEQPVIVEVIHCTTGGLEARKERYVDMQSRMLRIDPSPTMGDTIRVRMTLSRPEKDTLYFSAAVLNAEIIELCRSNLEPYSLSEISYGANTLSGKILAPASGNLWLSVPYDEGWSVKVDGQKTQPFAANKVFMGIHLTSGEHVITMEYIPSGLKTCTWLSIASLIMAICICVAGRAAKRPAKREVKEEE